MSIVIIVIMVSIVTIIIMIIIISSSSSSGLLSCLSPRIALGISRVVNDRMFSLAHHWLQRGCALRGGLRFPHSSSPQISAILLGRSTGEMAALQSFRKNSADSRGRRDSEYY